MGLTRALAGEGVARGIRVNAVAPMASTRLNESVMTTIFGRAVEQLSPDRVAPATAYLVHRDCALNGEVVSAAGGRVARFAVGTGPTVTGLASPEAVRDGIGRVRATEPASWWIQPGGQGPEAQAAVDSLSGRAGEKTHD